MTRLTIWHDGAWPLCRREIALIRRIDRRGAIDFVDASDAASGCAADRDALLARFHAREDGQMLSGTAAFAAAMWRAIPLLHPLGLAARNRIMLAGLERARSLRHRRPRPWAHHPGAPHPAHAADAAAPGARRRSSKN